MREVSPNKKGYGANILGLYADFMQLHCPVNSLQISAKLWQFLGQPMGGFNGFSCLLNLSIKPSSLVN
jgi:hypothetical protein